MQKITTLEELETAIQKLEIQQKDEWILLKNQFSEISENLKPMNIIKNGFEDMITSSDLKTDVINSVISITSGLAVKKVLIGETHNPFSKFAGNILEMVVSNKVLKNIDVIKSTGSFILKKIFVSKSVTE